MKKLAVIALVHKELVPPESLEGLSDKEIHPFKMEYDVLTALRNLGHDVRTVRVEDELIPIRGAIDEQRPDIVFNLLAHFQSVGSYEAFVMSFVELLHVPYTGCNARAMLLAGDKALTKKILAYHRILVPRFATFRRGRPIRMPRRLDFPLFVKSLDEHSSVGVAQASVVEDEASLRERVQFVHDYVGSDAIAEQYVRGRELTVSVLGNHRLRAFPVWELTFDNLPAGSDVIATWKLKWDVAYQQKVGARTAAASLPDDDERRAQRLGRRVYRALGLSGYARVDIRMSEDGRMYVLEANPNPDLSLDEDFAEAAQAVGIGYESLVQRVLNLGLRWAPPWRGGG